MPVVELPPTTTMSHEVVVPGATGFDPTVRVYSPPTEGTGRPCVYWIHGGGYLFGSGLNVDARINRWVEEFDCVGGVDRVPPRARGPVPGAARRLLRRVALDRTTRRRAGHRPDPDRRRRCERGRRARGRPRDPGARPGRDLDLAFQLLDLSDDRRQEHHACRATSTARRCGAARPTTSAGAPTSATLAGKDYIPAYAAPARVDDVAGLPPAWIGVGALDVFRDEDITYASRLLAAGHPHRAPRVPRRVRTASR